MKLIANRGGNALLYRKKVKVMLYGYKTGIVHEAKFTVTSKIWTEIEGCLFLVPVSTALNSWATNKYLNKHSVNVYWINNVLEIHSWFMETLLTSSDWKINIGSMNTWEFSSDLHIVYI